MTAPESAQAVLACLPAPRLKPFLDAAAGDHAEALALYAWNARMSGAALEQLSHLEVLLRHAVDVQLAKSTREDLTGIPWFLLPPYVTAQQSAIDAVRDRLRPLGRETRNQIVAGLSFGFWTGWVGKKYEDLWRQSLHLAFPHGSGRRQEVSVLGEQIRKFRNRIAHHDSLLRVDIGFEMAAVFRLAEIINPDGAAWMQSVDNSRSVGFARPIVSPDTVVVPAQEAWALYQDAHAYICQPGRYFQAVSHLAFYAHRQVQPEVPRVKSRHDNVPWNEAEAFRLLESGDRDERKLGEVMRKGLDAGWGHGVCQVFLLSHPGDPSHVTLAGPIENDRIGKASGFVRKQRYTSVHQLRHAHTVWEL